MTNNEEINELLKCSICEYFKNGVCTTKEYCEYERHRAIVVMQEFAQWKDEQFEKEKQQLIDKACKLMQHWILEHDYVDIMELEDYVKQKMEDEI